MSKIIAEKFFFSKDGLEYFGMKINRQGTMPLRNKIKVSKDMYQLRKTHEFHRCI